MTLQVSQSSGGSAALACADTEPNGVPTMTDPATAMLALILQSRGTQSEVAREDVNRAKEMIEQARQEIADAVKRAAEAREHSGFWHQLGTVFKGDIGTLCELVAAAAVVAGTGGVGAAGVLAIAAAGLAVGSTVAEKLGADPKVCLALSATGALAGLAVGNLSSASEFWLAVANGSRLVGVGAGAAGTGAQITANNYQADALIDDADATGARGRQSAALFDFDIALDQLARAAGDINHATSTSSSIVKNENDGRTALIARLGAA